MKWAKANPKLANYGIPAAGSALHFAGMMLQKAAGIDFNSVAYRGGAPLLQDVLGGQVPVSFNVLGEVLPHIRSGKLRALAVTTPQRSPLPAGRAHHGGAGLQGHRDDGVPRAGSCPRRRRRTPCAG